MSVLLLNTLFRASSSLTNALMTLGTSLKDSTASNARGWGADTLAGLRGEWGLQSQLSQHRLREPEQVVLTSWICFLRFEMGIIPPCQILCGCGPDAYRGLGV